MGTAAAAQERISHWPISRLDVAGAFGDIGVLFPIALALITLNHLNPTAVFLTAGLTYILAGRYFQIPIPVQPFKAVAAIALALSLKPSEIASAGLLMGILLALVGLTNVAGWLARLFSRPIVRGIQLGLGMLLALEGLRMIFGPKSEMVFPGPGTIQGWMLGMAGAALLMLFLRSRRFPAALALLAAGVALGVMAHFTAVKELRLGPLPLEILHPRIPELRRVLLLLVVPQFALTFGNSIVATEETARILYGEQARRVTAKALSLSIGVTNLISGMLISAPTCHGSGGVTAHYKFGGRTQKSNYIIGSCCLLLALFGRSAAALLMLIPTAILGVFLAFVGIQHAAYIHDIIRRPPALAVALLVGFVSLATTNLTYGFLAGFGLEGIFLLLRRHAAQIGP